MLSKQFEVDKFGLYHDNPKDFSLSSLQSDKEVLMWWIFYRTVMFGYFFATFLYCFIAWPLQDDLPSSDKGKFLIHLTVWAYTVETLVFFLGLVVAARDYNNQSRNNEESDVSAVSKTFWVLYSALLPVSMLVTIGFWALLYKKSNFKMSAINIIMHITNSALIFIDFILVAFPYRFLHFYMHQMFLILYVIFSVIYELSGGTGVKGQRPIYEKLDWENATSETFLYVIVCFLGTFVVHVIFSFIYVLKLYLKSKTTD